jgi:thymidylate synthase
MATCLTVPNLRTGYVDICRAVLKRGSLTSPRGQLTRELLDVTIEVMNPADCLPIGVGRKLNSAIAAAEALQLIGGVSLPELMVRISPNFEKFIDDRKFWGGYGDRVRLDPGGESYDVHQAEVVVNRLTADKDSRQAVIALWRPELDLNWEGKHDYPCTLSLMFTVRNGHLQLHTTMRSNDVWWGLAYDAFQFTQLQLTVAHALGVPVGSYVHHAISLHAYERDWANIEGLTYPTVATPPDLPRGIRALDADRTPWEELQYDARALLDRRFGPTHHMSHPWWTRTLGQYL